MLAGGLQRRAATSATCCGFALPYTLVFDQVTGAKLRRGYANDQVTQTKRIRSTNATTEQEDVCTGRLRGHAHDTDLEGRELTELDGPGLVQVILSRAATDA